MLTPTLRKNLESSALKIFQKNKTEIIDIILFGSVLTGKEKPNDVDILIIFKEKKDVQVAYELRKLMEKYFNIPVQVTIKLYTELFQSDFLARESILNQGYSLLNKRGIAEGFGYENQIMFIYQLSGKTKSERMRFYYSLYGRNTDGMLKILKAKKYTDTVILCPLESFHEMQEYLKSWNIDFKEVPILIPRRLI